MTVSRFQFRRANAFAWSSANPTLAAGELGFELDTGQFKIGNGTTSWNSLVYYSSGGSGIAGATAPIVYDEETQVVSINYGTGLIASNGILIADFGTASSKITEGNDPRLSDARTPIAHKTSHAIGGSDVLSAADIGAATSGHDHSDTYVPLTAVGTTVASLTDGKVPTNQLPSIAITDTFVVNSQAAMLALTAETGDVVIRTDLSKSFILSTNDPTTLENWKELITPLDTHTTATTSVHGISNTANLITLAGTQTLTNKTIDLGSNTITGTLAQFNTALTDQDFASLAGTETLSNKTLTAPNIGVATGTSLNVSNNLISTAGTIIATAGTISGSLIIGGSATITSTISAAGLAGSLLSSATPLVSSGAGSAGASAIPSRQDHAHPAPVFKQEAIGTISSTSGTIAYDYNTATTFYHTSSPTADWTINFTNVSTDNTYAYNFTIVVPQGSTAYKVSAVQIAGVAATIKWAGSTSTPVGNNSKTDIWVFTLFRVSGAWTVLGVQSANFG